MEAWGKRRASVLLVAGLALAMSACGARWTDEQAATVQQRRVVVDTAGSGPVTAGGRSSTGRSEVPRAGATGGSGAVGPVGADPGQPSSDAPTGGGTPVASGGDAGALPCAAPSDAPGVSAERLAIGSISTLSGAVPGLGTSSAAAVRAHVAHRNATGGVCGRQVELVDADDGGDRGRYRALLGDMAEGTLALAGGLTIADDGAGDVVQGAGLPFVVSRAGEGVQGQPTVFELNPPYADLTRPIGKYQYLASQGVRSVALAYLAVDASRAEARTQQSLMEASGMEIVEVVELPVSTLSFDSAARRVANSGAEHMLFIGDANSNGSMARAMADAGHDLLFTDYFAFAYGPRFIELAGAAAEGTTAWLRTLPVEEAATNREVAAFVEWMERASAGAPKDEFAAESWAAAKLVLDSLEALPGPIAREALVAQLRATESWDADGLMGANAIGAQQNGGCFVGLQVRSGRWERLAPASGFAC